MPITKRRETFSTVRPDGQIEVREDTVLEEDGVEMTRLHARRVIIPGQDVSGETDDMLKRVAQAAHTPDVVQRFRRARDGQ